jgi:hypothetical protein
VSDGCLTGYPRTAHETKLPEKGSVCGVHRLLRLKWTISFRAVEADVQLPWSGIINQMEIGPKGQRPMIGGGEEQGPILRNETEGLMCLMDVLPDILP